MGAPIVGRP